ncbi:MAG: glycosyltransferase family 39 protein [Bacteroidetes bacterium]|nr:glycosyltransferase family 39 protein [Bacteroidota bacterium]
MSQPLLGDQRTGTTWLWVAIALFAAMVAYVNPLRDVAVDDDWTYTATVRHLVETGQYQLDQFSVPNMPFQIYTAALFSQAIGFSLSTVRLVTIVMAFIGLAGFYKLARENDLDQRTSSLLALIWAGSPLLAHLSFTFMTEVTFMACMVVALWLYSRATRLLSLPTMLLASVAASAAILTRQFGAVIVGALFLVWITDRNLRRRFLLFIAGAVLPAIAVCYQVWAGMNHPTWAQGFVKTGVTTYVSDVGGFLFGLLWRPVVLILYIALFSLPMLVPMISEWIASLRSRGSAQTGAGAARGRSPWIAAGAAAAIVLILLGGSILFHLPIRMPIVPWNFNILARSGRVVTLGITVVLAAGAALLVRTLLADRAARGSWRASGNAWPLLAITSACFLVFNLTYYKFGDDYALPYLPFLLITAGHYLRPFMARHARSIGIVGAAMVVVCALWIRGWIEAETAAWKAADTVLAKGVNPRRINGLWNWDCYHGAFNEFQEDIGHRPISTLDSMYIWYRDRRSRCNYVIASTPKIEGGPWAEEGRMPYRTFLLSEHYIYIMRREQPLAP